jgi:uncharacterized membrane protein YdfJ with MMPL/SSD domain
MAPRSRLHSVITVTETERRFAIALRRLRWPTVIVWLLAIVLLHGLSVSLSKVTNDTAGNQQTILQLTGGVITAAGVVLAGTFAALTQIPQVDITEVGTAVALGVLLDTLLVRTVLVPASLLTIGERVWWPGRRHHHPGPARHRQGDLEPL